MTSTSVVSPLAAAVVSIDVSEGEKVKVGQSLVLLESIKIQTTLKAPVNGIIEKLYVEVGQTLQANVVICEISPLITSSNSEEGRVKKIKNKVDLAEGNDHAWQEVHALQALTLDEQRSETIEKRHSKGYRSARENLNDLVDAGSFVEYGQLAVAAQRGRRTLEDLRSNTPADGIITGLATVNSELFGDASTNAGIIINDFTVLAGTQGYFHHRKLDRIIDVAYQKQIPTIMYTEGGGGRPGDTDAAIVGGGLNVNSFYAWAKLGSIVPTIAVNNGYCFAGNAALFGCATIRIATKTSWIGMAGPAMIEGGGLGSFKPTQIGPIDVQSSNAVVDIVAENEAEATSIAKQILAYFQGALTTWQCSDQTVLRRIMPADRRFAYDVRQIINILADTSTFTELTRDFGGSIVTGFVRIEGKTFGLMANDCRILGGAIDSTAADKAARFLQLCNRFQLPLLSLCDTPGFMVGPASEELGAARRMSALFSAGAELHVPVIAILLRKGYGLGAMAMVGGSFAIPALMAAWPVGEIGPMGLEGAVRLGYKKELEAQPEGEAREALFKTLVDKMYEQGKACESAAGLELDAVIDPADTRRVILRALQH